MLMYGEVSKWSLIKQICKLIMVSISSNRSVRSNVSRPLVGKEWVVFFIYMGEGSKWSLSRFVSKLWLVKVALVEV